MRYNTFEKRSRAKWALEAEMPLPKPDCEEYTPEMIAWQSKYNTFMKENFGGRIEMVIVPFNEMPEYQNAMNKLICERAELLTLRPEVLRFDCILGYIYCDQEAGDEWERRLWDVDERMRELEEEMRY